MQICASAPLMQVTDCQLWCPQDLPYQCSPRPNPRLFRAHHPQPALKVCSLLWILARVYLVLAVVAHVWPVIPEPQMIGVLLSVTLDLVRLPLQISADAALDSLFLSNAFLVDYSLHKIVDC